MKRFNDWQVRFEAFYQQRCDVPFAWGRNDCALFAADAVQAITGAHLCPELRGHRDVRDGLRAMDRLGGMRAIATLALGEPVAPLMARIGDVVAVKAGKREALAVCNGDTALAAGPAGVVAVSMAHAVAAWRVG